MRPHGAAGRLRPAHARRVGGGGGAGAQVVLGGASEPDEPGATRRVAAGMAAAYGMTVLIANRAGSAGLRRVGRRTVAARLTTTLFEL